MWDFYSESIIVMGYYGKSIYTIIRVCFDIYSRNQAILNASEWF